MALAAVIFDFDGVLADSEPVHLQVFQTVLDSIGITLTRRGVLREVPGLQRPRRVRARAEGPRPDDRGRQPRGAARNQEGAVPAGHRRSRAVPGRGRVHRARGRARAGGHRLRRLATRDRADPRAQRPRRTLPRDRRRRRDAAQQARARSLRARLRAARCLGRAPGRSSADRRRGHRGLRVGAAVGPRRRPANAGGAHLVRQGQPARAPTRGCRRSRR